MEYLHQRSNRTFSNSPKQEHCEMYCIYKDITYARLNYLKIIRYQFKLSEYFSFQFGETCPNWRVYLYFFLYAIKLNLKNKSEKKWYNTNKKLSIRFPCTSNKMI